MSPCARLTSTTNPEDSAVEKESNPSESPSREMADNQNQAAEGDGNTTDQNQDPGW